jgi:bifunctional DNase/RNase
MPEIRMDLVKILIQERSDHQVIVLKERDGERMFPILIGPYEAMAIDRRVKNVVAPRPLTHDLLNNTISGLGGVLARIVINDLQDNTFYAKLIVQTSNGDVEIDSRPSDAIALASLENTPIFVEEAVLEEAENPF